MKHERINKFYAHSTKNNDQTDWHTLKDHLECTAALAFRFGESLGIGNATRVAGLLHDIGKYGDDFQERLRGKPIRVDHSTAGAALVGQLAKKGDDRFVAELIAYAIAGHHAGLPDKREKSKCAETSNSAGRSLKSRIDNFSLDTLNPAWKNEILPDCANLMPVFRFTNKARVPFQFSVLGRMIFSCLVDADFKDTESFFSDIDGRKMDRDWPSLPQVLPSLLDSLDSHISQLQSQDTVVNRLRNEVLTHARIKAGDEPGLFTFTVPTGGGKTLASMAFALEHARKYGQNRIIYAIPFTSIVDQTAEIFRRVFGDEIILEHHTSIETNNADSKLESRDKLRLAMEDWAAPVIVTTNVQFFESLFAARPSRCRKLHNIANSIIILDEAQTLPRNFLLPCVRMLEELSENYGCTIIMCTATQPALDSKHFKLSLENREIAPEPSRLARELRRVSLRHAGPMSNEQLTASLASVHQGLIIVNSRKHALALYSQAKSEELDGLLHLTTRQYAAHRKLILDMVRGKLREGTPCRLIATSLVEAGVDLDFPRVWRAEAGLDQIAQAAGRCNREGRRPVDDSIVTIFSAPDFPPPSEIKSLSGDMMRIAKKHEDLLSPNAIEEFFQEVYWRIGPEGLDREGVLGSFKVDSTGTEFDYRTVAESFRMIESGLVPIIIARDKRAMQSIDKLGMENISSGTIARELQSYIVLVPPKARAKLILNGHVSFQQEKLRSDQFAMLVTYSLYKDETGLLWEDADYLALEDLII